MSDCLFNSKHALLFLRPKLNILIFCQFWAEAILMNILK